MDSTAFYSGDPSSKSNTNDNDLLLQKLQMIKESQDIMDFDLLEENWDVLEDTKGEQHINLDDPLYGRNHNLKQYLDNGANSLVFNSTILNDVQVTCSFDSLFENMTAITTDGGVKKITLKVGNGTKPGKGSQVWVHYIMFAEKDEVIRNPFDSTNDRQHMDTFLLNGERIPCMNIALDSMEYNEVSVFISTPLYAFGPLGCFPRVPPDSKILFIIELFELDTTTMIPLFRMSAEGRQSLDFKKVLHEVKEMNEVGNIYFNNKAYEDALRVYEMGINILVNYVTAFPADRNDKKRQLYTMYCNQAETFLRLRQSIRVCETFENVQQQEIPMYNGKLLYRYAKALYKKNKLTKALEALEESLRIEPGHSEILNFRSQVLSKLEAEEREGVALAKKMGQKFVTNQADNEVWAINLEQTPGPSGNETVATKQVKSVSGHTIPFSVKEQFEAATALDVMYKKKPSIFLNRPI